MGNSKGRNRNPNRNHQHPERERRRIEAEARQNVRNKFTAEQQLQHLDDTLGVGVGALKERARLTLQVTTKSVPSPKAVAVPTDSQPGGPKKPKSKYSKRLQK